jgi:hypothetical protein
MNPFAHRFRFSGTRLSVLGRSALAAFAAALALMHAGCGSGGSSGQILHASGFYAPGTATALVPTSSSNVPDAGRTVSLSTTISVPNDTNADGILDGGFIGLQNMQTADTIITEGARLSYSIPGSSFALPDASFMFSVSLPPQSSTSNNTVYAQILLVSAAMMDFLRANTGSLPPPPFTMVIAVGVQGHSSNGTNFVSNTINYNLTFTD